MSSRCPACAHGCRVGNKLVCRLGVKGACQPTKPTGGFHFKQKEYKVEASKKQEAPVPERVDRTAPPVEPIKLGMEELLRQFGRALDEHFQKLMEMQSTLVKGS